jgi:uncharacterized iron-regulated protein
MKHTIITLCFLFGLACMGQTISIDSVSQDSVKRYYVKVVIPDTLSINLTKVELESILKDNQENLDFASETVKAQYLYYRGMLQAEKPRKQAEETIKANQMALQRLLNERALLLKISETIKIK